MLALPWLHVGIQRASPFSSGRICRWVSQYEHADGCKWQDWARRQNLGRPPLVTLGYQGWTQEGFISPFITSFIYSCPWVPVLWFPTPYRPTWQVPSTTDLMGCHFRPQVVILGWPDRSHPHDNIRTIYHVTKVIWIDDERVCQEMWIDDVLLLTRRKGRTKLLFWS